MDKVARQLLRYAGFDVWYHFYLMELRRDLFVHFTPRQRAYEILSSGKLLMHPPYPKFGIDVVAAVSTVWGKYVPGVQHTHIKGGDLVAILFRTPTKPKYGHAEEVIWNRDVVLSSAKIIPMKRAQSMIMSTPHYPGDWDADRDFVVVYSEQDLPSSLQRGEDPRQIVSSALSHLMSHKVSSLWTAARRRPDQPQTQEEEEKRQRHIASAREDFDKVLSKVRGQARQVLNLVEDDPKKLRRELRNRLSDLIRPLLITYLGHITMDPQVRGLHRKALALLVQYALGEIQIGDFRAKMGPLFSKGFEIIQVATAQSKLRQEVPGSIRSFLPKNVVINLDREGYIQSTTDLFHNEYETLKIKGDRQKDLLRRYNSIVRSVNKDLRSSNPKIRLAAIVTAIVMETGIRPGRGQNKTKIRMNGEVVEVETFGATTLKAEHVNFVRGNFAYLEFVGKKGTLNKANLTNRRVIKALKDYVQKAHSTFVGKKAQEPDFLFVGEDGTQFNYGMLNRYFKRKAELQGLEISDFRRLKATKSVLENLYLGQKSLYEKIRNYVDQKVEDLKERVVEEVSKTVQKAYLQAQEALSHEDVRTTVHSYVNPEVLLRYLSRGAAENELRSFLLKGQDKFVFDIDKFISNAVQAPAMVRTARAENTLGALLEEIEVSLEELEGGL